MFSKRLFVYKEDIVIHAKTLEEHKELFDEVMSPLCKASWKLEPKMRNIITRSNISWVYY